jgi:hypothetical protein
MVVVTVGMVPIDPVAGAFVATTAPAGSGGHVTAHGPVQRTTPRRSAEAW